MSLRSQIGRVLGVKAVRAWEQRRQPQQSLAKPSDYHKAILTLSEGNSLIREALIAGGPYLAGRAGTVELDCITHHLETRRGRASKKDYPESVVFMMSNNAGFFPATNGTLDRFAEQYLEAVRQLDAMCVWFNRGESDLAREFCSRADLVPLRLGRAEPRAVKRRPKPYQRLTQHRRLFRESVHRGKRRGPLPWLS